MHWKVPFSSFSVAVRRVILKFFFLFPFFYTVASARITPHTLSFVKKLVSTFGIGFESASSVSSTFSSAASESLARRAQATAQDPVFQRLKEQFAIDFDFT